MVAATFLFVYGFPFCTRFTGFSKICNTEIKLPRTDSRLASEKTATQSQLDSLFWGYEVEIEAFRESLGWHVTPA